MKSLYLRRTVGRGGVVELGGRKYRARMLKLMSGFPVLVSIVPGSRKVAVQVYSTRNYREICFAFNRSALKRLSPNFRELLLSRLFNRNRHVPAGAR